MHKKGYLHTFLLGTPSFIPAFSLLEMAFVLMIMGCVSGMTIPFFSKQLSLEKEKKTQHTFEQITYSLAAFFLHHKRLPCPASPVAASHDHGIEFLEDCDKPGLVPYKTLGMSPSLAKDGHHHWITYAVSPDFARYELVFQNEDEKPSVSLSNDPLISPFGGHHPSFLSEQHSKSHLKNYWSMIDANPIILLDEKGQSFFQDPLMSPLFLLISHGTKGGDFLEKSTQRRKMRDTESPGKTAKEKNASNDLTFIDHPKSLSFDDEVFFKNRFLFARLYAGISAPPSS